MTKNANAKTWQLPVSSNGRRYSEPNDVPGAFDYYIGPSGSDSNPGTLASPWAITALQSKSGIIAGKVIGLLDGTHVCNIGATDQGGTGGIQWNAAGCTLKAVNARLAIITTNNGVTYPQIVDPCIQILAANCTIDGVKFYQSQAAYLRVTGTGTTIKNCWFEDALQSRNVAYSTANPNDNFGAIITAISSFPTWTVDNCYFSNIYNANASENCCGIGPLYYAGNTTITRCTFKNSANGIGWKSDNAGPLTVNQCYFDSTISRVAVHGGMSNDVYNIPMQFTFKNNVVNRVGYALDSWEASSPGDTENWTDIQHNTFVMDNNLYGAEGVVYSDALTGRVLSGAELHHCVLRDNVFQLVSGVQPILYWQTGRNASVDLYGTIDYNLYSTVKMKDADGVTYSTLANWQTRTGQESHSLNASATFVNSTGGTPASYALASGSGKNAASDGTDMGAWGGGVTQIGSSF